MDEQPRYDILIEGPQGEKLREFFCDLKNEEIIEQARKWLEIMLLSNRQNTTDITEALRALQKTREITER